MSCTNPLYAVQWYPYSGHNPCTLVPQFYFNRFRDKLIIRVKYKGDFAAYCRDAIDSKTDYKIYRDYRPLYLPCGKCAACKLKYARDWSIRGLMEMMSHRYHYWQVDADGNKIDYIDKKSCFLTLTIDDEHLSEHGIIGFNKPEYGQYVSIRVLQLFLKRLRKELNKHNIQVRYLACGEYGSLHQRPHYHLILFGWYPDDVELHSINALGDKVYISSLLSKLWTLGHHFIGDANDQSISYVAGYVSKKLETKLSFKSKKFLPFITMSRKPGLGFDFFKDYEADFKNDQVRVADKVFQVPRYFMKYFEKHKYELSLEIKENRLKSASERWKNTYSDASLHRLEDFNNLKLKKKVRNYEL